MGKLFQASPVQMQHALTALFAGSVVTVLFVGGLSDTFGRRPVLLSSLFLFSLASMACALSSNLQSLLISRFCQGLCMPTFTVLVRSMVSDLFPPIQVRKLMGGKVVPAASVVPALAPVLGAILLLHWGWSSIFWSLSFWGVGLFFWIYFQVPESLPFERHQKFWLKDFFLNAKNTFSNTDFLCLSAMTSLTVALVLFYLLASPVFLGQHLGLMQGQFFYFFWPCVVFSVLGGFSGHWLVKRVSNCNQLLIGVILIFFLALCNFLTQLLLTPSLLTSLFFVVLLPFSATLIIPCLNVKLANLFPNWLGMMFSLDSFFNIIAIALVSGFLIPFSIRSIVNLASANLFLAILLVLSYCFHLRLEKNSSQFHRDLCHGDRLMADQFCKSAKDSGTDV